MNLIVKRLDESVVNDNRNHILYVQTEDGTNVRAEICTEEEVSNYIYILKSDHNIKQGIFFDL